MAVEAVQPHRREVMAFAAELLVLIDGHRLPVRPRRDVAGHASRQAVLRRPDATMNGLIPLMFDHFHVIAAHVFRRLDAARFLRGLRARDHKARPTGLDGQGQPGPDQTKGDATAY